MSRQLSLHLLGPPKVELDQAPVIIDQRKTLGLLAYLAIDRWYHHRDQISSLFWPDYPQPKAFSNLRHVLWEMRQAIGDAWIDSRRDTIGLKERADVRVDVTDFNALISQSLSESNPSLRIPLLTRVVKLYRNHFMAGFTLKDAPGFNEWASSRSEELRHQAGRALAMLADDLCSSDHADLAIPHAQRLVALDPLNETSHRRLMQIYLQAGQPAAALKQYQTCEKILRTELGIDPEPATRALYRQIRRGEIKPTPTRRPGERGLIQHNLPFQISKFIGREKELDVVKAMLNTHRLVTLVGTGGIGKTRLSLKVGEDILRNYTQGVWFVELASLQDPAFVLQTVAKLFNIMERADESLIETLVRVMRSRTVLLILDNCEHLLDACAQMADALLKNCPQMSILATSREPLGIVGEALYHVPPLALPDVQQVLDTFLEFESIQLFVERARLVQEQFSPTLENAPAISRICQRLDGMPLAIELAAARVDLLSPEQIAMRLDESIDLLTGGGRATLPRHQTLRASIDWSWNLLSEPEHLFLRRLSVFAGGWTLEAAEAVCAGNGIERPQVLEVMAQLVTKSLVVSKADDERERRYHLLETIRQYAHEKLQEANEVDEIRDKHLLWMLNWAENIAPELRSRNQVERMEQVDLEVDNVRTSVDWALGKGDAELAMRIFIPLQHYWDGHQPYQESLRWLEKGISFGERLSRRTLVRTFTERSWIAFRKNDPGKGIEYGNRGLMLAREMDEPSLAANALRALGCSLILQSDFKAAEKCFEESYSLCQNLDDDAELAMTAGDHALALMYQGEIERADAILEAHLDRILRLEDLRTKAHVLLFLGGAKVLKGNWEAASTRLKECLRLSRQLNNILLIGDCLIVLAGVANRYDAPARAARLFGAQEVLHESIGSELDPGFRHYYTAFVAETRAMLEDSTFESAWAEGRAMTLDETIDYAVEDSNQIH